LHYFDADADPACHFDADPDKDPVCHFDADPDTDPHPTCHFDPTFHFDAGRNLEKVLK
jgi:hypothetical protein